MSTEVIVGIVLAITIISFIAGYVIGVKTKTTDIKTT